MFMADLPNNDNNSDSSEEEQFETSQIQYKTSYTAVRKARRFTVQGLYEWLMTDYRFAQQGKHDWKHNTPNKIMAHTRANNAMHTVHLGYYHELMSQIPQQIEELYQIITPCLDRDLNKIDLIEQAILLIGAYELQYSLHIPYKVVIDEAMKLNTHFGATDGHKLINVVMDSLAKELRSAEVEADKKSKDDKKK